jgi:hypothetical protein
VLPEFWTLPAKHHPHISASTRRNIRDCFAVMVHTSNWLWLTTWTTTVLTQQIEEKTVEHNKIIDCLLLKATSFDPAMGSSSGDE